MRRRLLLGVGVAMAAGAAALLAGPAGVVSAALGGLGVWLWLCSTRRAADPEAAWARSVLDALGQGVVRLDARHCVTYANPAAAALVGYDAAALLGQPFAMVLLPEDFPQWLQALTQAPAGAAYHYEARLRRPDGQWRPARLICQPGGRATQPGETVITLTDLTEPRQAETHSRLLAAGVEAMPVGLLLTDRQGRVVYSNPAVSALTGYTAAELRGQSMRLLKSGWQSPALYEALWAALLAGQVWRGELVNRRQDGRLYTQESVLVPVRADGDIITHFAALVQDISQRQQSEADLRANEAKYRLLVENSSDGITMTDEQGRVVEWSVAQEAITGLGRPAALGRPLWELMDDLALPERRTPESRAQLRAGVMQVLSTGQMPWAYEYRTLEIWRPEGTRRTVEAVAYPIQTETGWLLCAIMRDVTDRLQAETAIRQLNQALEQRVLERTHQLEAANQALEAERAQLAARVAARTADLSAANAELARAARAKDEFLASMSHELRTPLNTVLGLAEVLQEGGFGALAPEQADAVAGIEESGRHLLAVINDILDLSKIEAGQLQLQLEPVDVAAVCQASVRLIRETAQRNGLSVTVAVDPAAAEVLADERRLKQMLVNLLSNACKFTPAGGSLG
ncbi:MAG: PAS domain S-box protein, partial [Anaerolineales bacterium]|nr:PAS domain S-box protein [Anaerolineales bacterium]